jgi:hypothetical protein
VNPELFIPPIKAGIAPNATGQLSYVFVKSSKNRP